MPVKIGKDGLPIITEANPDCPMCKGYGVVDTGENYGCILTHCPTCIEKVNETYNRKQAKEE